MIGILREDDTFCLSANASPVVQLLLRVLRDRGDRALAAEAAAAVVGGIAAGSQKGSSPCVYFSERRCADLLRSAPGSRALEAVLEVGSAEVIRALFAEFFRSRLGDLIRGESGNFGAFVAQRVVDSLREEPQLMLALGEIDFASCLGTEGTPTQRAVVVKALEACLRLRAGLKQCAAAIFQALDLRVSAEYHRAWPTLLTLERVESVAGLLRSPPRHARVAIADDIAGDG